MQQLINGGIKMLFQTKDFYVDIIDNKDLNEIVEIYNSNKNFLLSHMNMENITGQWVIEEIESMKKAGFYSCKIVDIPLGKMIGIIDFKIGKETYLSLLVIHKDLKCRGYGKLILHAFEEYAKTLKSQYIRIDVVTNYDSSVLDFWIKNKFIKFEEVELNWVGKILPAVSMKKYL